MKLIVIRPTFLQDFLQFLANVFERAKRLSDIELTNIIMKVSNLESCASLMEVGACIIKVEPIVENN